MDAKLLILMETTKQKFGYLNQDHNCEAAKKEMAAFFVVNENFSQKHLRDEKVVLSLQRQK